MALLPEKLAAFGLTKVYEDIELPLCPVLAEMEQAGMLVDEQALASLGPGLTAGIALPSRRRFGPRRGRNLI